MTFTEQDIRNMVFESIRQILRENREDELVGWHGSAADFSQFDTNFIGTGESTQAYGWGIYITGIRENGNFYAALIARNKHGRDRSNQAIVMNKKIEDSLKSPIKNLRKGNISFEECKSMVLKNMRVNGVDEFFIKKYEQVKNLADNHAFVSMALEIASRAYQRFVYTVEIPDDGFIEWYNNDPQLIQTLFQKFMKAFKNIKVDINSVQTFGDLYCQVAGGPKCKTLYHLKNPQIPPREISEFLMGLGYKGITVPIGSFHGGDSKGLNYILFSGDFIKILKKEMI